ncbi:MAG: alpha/beta hydrolase fold domain-containing protein [Alphaproteobacteria bacterium]|nr:alpha/beta hydrolase fold domain-containing protein [Alphaproteobacteria bacterium]
MNEPVDPIAFLDPECRPILARMAAGRERRRNSAVSIAAIRTNAAALFAPWNAGGAKPAHIETVEIPGAAGPRRIRRYTPHTGAGPQPTLFYMHGGGWIVGDLDSEDRYLREAAVESGIQIISLEYALAPEHRFPVPLDDCVALIESALEQADRFQIDTGRIALGGASAGANLAIATAMSLRDRDIKLAGLLLNCGVFAIAHQSRGQAIDDTGPGPADMQYFLSQYVEDTAQRDDPRVNILNASLGGLPFTRIIAAAIDPLRDDSFLLARRLSDFGVACDLSVHPGVIHGFMGMCGELTAARPAIREAADYLKHVFKVS